MVDKPTVDACVQRHFMQFAIRYHARAPSTSHDRALLRGHLAVLCALAKTKSEVVARRFYQLCVMDLCVHELSLECQLGSGVVGGVQEVCVESQHACEAATLDDDPTHVHTYADTTTTGLRQATGVCTAWQQRTRLPMPRQYAHHAAQRPPERICSRP